MMTTMTGKRKHNNKIFAWLDCESTNTIGNNKNITFTSYVSNFGCALSFDYEAMRDVWEMLSYDLWSTIATLSFISQQCYEDMAHEWLVSMFNKMNYEACTPPADDDGIIIDRERMMHSYLGCHAFLKKSLFDLYELWLSLVFDFEEKPKKRVWEDREREIN